MAPSIMKRTLILVTVACVVATAVVLARPTPSSALPAYGAATGQACGTCHVNPAGGGPRTAQGQAFEAISTHSTDPAGAWAQVTAPASPQPAPAPVATGALSVVLSGVASDDSVSYAVTVSNTGDKDASDIFISGSIPTGAALSSTGAVPESAGALARGPVPEDAALFAKDASSVSWVLNGLPAKSSIGPFVYKVSKGTATNLSAHAFIHWLSPSEGTAVSATVAPVDNSTRLGVDQEINSKLNNLDRTLNLWNLQPGLGTVMIEYAIRFGNMWFAAQAGNWDMAHYQNLEMREIQEVGESTRPARAAALKNFEDSFLDPLDDAASAKDLRAFTAAYDKAIAGCNSCHAGQTSGDFPGGYRFVKIQRPTAPVFPNVDWKGQQ